MLNNSLTIIVFDSTIDPELTITKNYWGYYEKVYRSFVFNFLHSHT